ELPSSVRLCHYRDKLAGEAQANLPPQGLSNALRKTHLLKGMDRILEGGNYGWDAGPSVRSSQRHRGCAADAKSEAQLIGTLPDNTMRQEHCGNARAEESVESQRRASHSFHEPLGNLVQQQARFPHSHSAGDEGDGKVENQKQVSHFPTAPRIYWENQRKAKAGELRPPKATKN